MKIFALFTALSISLASTLVLASVPVNGGMPGNDQGAYKCVTHAEASLNSKGVHDATLVQIEVRQNGSEVPMPQGFDFFYSSPSCGGNGYIVVTTTDYCYTQQVYTRYNCKVPGLPHFNF